jgi:hypothetical protein
LPTLSADNAARLSHVLSLPQQIRGFGHVKQVSVDRYRRELAQTGDKLSHIVINGKHSA